MSKFSKIINDVDFSNRTVPELRQSIVDEIAYKLLVEKKSVKTVAIELQIPFVIIDRIKNTTTHKEKWLCAIAKWGRLNLIVD
jgi:hypothetical protein